MNLKLYTLSVRSVLTLPDRDSQVICFLKNCHNLVYPFLIIIYLGEKTRVHDPTTVKCIHTYLETKEWHSIDWKNLTRSYGNPHLKLNSPDVT